MDYKFIFTHSLSPQEKYLLWDFLFYSINNKKEKILINQKKTIDFIPFLKNAHSLSHILTSCVLKIDDYILANASNDLSPHIIYGQFFSTVFYNGKSLILLTVNPTTFKLLQAADLKKICTNFFFPSFSYARYFFGKILQANTSNTVEIRAEEIKNDLNLTSSAWKSFLYRLPSTEKRLASCGYLSTCQITVNHKRSAGAPVESIRISYEKSNHEYQTQMNSIFISVDDINGYSSSHDAFLLKGCCHTCGGKRLLKEDPDGNLFVCCTNSSFWHFGSDSCVYKDTIK